MQAHIVGGGFGGLAAAAYLIRNAGVPGPDITIYEAETKPGGGFFLGGDAKSGYNLPGSVFDAEFRCTFDLLADIPSTRDPSVSVKDEFFTFNAQNPFHDRAHIIDRNGQIVHGAHYGLSLRHGLDLVKLSLTPEALLDGRRIEELLPRRFLRDRVLAALVDHHGVAAAARRDGVPALHQPRPGPVPRSLGHAAHPAYADLPVSGVHRTLGQLAAGARREAADRHVRPRRRSRAGAGPHHGRAAGLRTGWRGESGRGRAGRHRAADDRIAGGGHLGRVDDRAAAAAVRQLVLGAVAAPGRRTGRASATPLCSSATRWCPTRAGSPSRSRPQATSSSTRSPR